VSDDGRALPSWALRVIRYGPDLRGRGDAAVDDALVRTAMSARRSGWTEPQWAGLLLERCCSQLGVMAARDAKGKPADIGKRLRRAWQRAELRTASPKIDRDRVPKLIGTVRRWVDAGCPRGRAGSYALTEEERAVLLAGCDRGERLGTTRPAMPWRAVATDTGLGPSAVRRTLARLDQRGLLKLAEAGWATKPGTGTPRAHAYALPVALASIHMCRSTAPVDGFPTPVDGDLENAGRPATPVDDLDGEDAMTEVILTVRGATLERVLAALERDGLIAAASPPDELPANVVELRRTP